ncbi:MAG: hypothetical protein AAF721_20925 [Myxococcota bacterium]
MRRAWISMAVLAPLGCAKPVAPAPQPVLPRVASTERPAPREIEEGHADARGPEIWLTAADHAPEFEGIGGCSFSVGYSGFPALSPSGDVIASAAWDDPGDNLGEEDLGRLRIARTKLDGPRQYVIVYDAESGPCDAIRSEIEARLQALRAELESWRSIPLIAGAAAQKPVGPGGPAREPESALSVFVEDGTLVFERENEEVLRYAVPGMPDWEVVDAVHGDADLGRIVIAVRVHGLKSADVVDLVIAEAPSTIFEVLSAHQPP